MGKNNDYKQVILENIYLLFLGIYLIKRALAATIFRITWPENFDIILRCLVLFLVVLKLGWGGGHNKGEWIRWSVIAISFLGSWYSSHYGILLDIALLMAGAIGVPYKKILNVYICCVGSVVLLAALGAMLGVIRDLLYESSGHFRHSFGILYPTNFASLILCLTLAGWLIYDNASQIKAAGIMLLIALLLFYYCRARCSTVIMVLLAVGAVSIQGIEHIYEKKMISKGAGLAKVILSVLMPICAGVIVVLSIIYDESNSIMRAINRIFTARLSLAKAAFETYSVTLWGTQFDQIGLGGDNFERIGYNMVDSSYCLILFRHGIVVLIIVCLAYVCVTRKALLLKQWKIVLVFALLAIHCMIEHHLLEMEYNVFFLLTFSDLRKHLKGAQGDAEKPTAFYKRIILGITIGVGILALSYGLEIGRTLVSIFSLNQEEKNVYFVLVGLVGIWLMGLSAYFLKKHLTTLKKDEIKKYAIVGVGVVSVMSVFGSFIIGPEIYEKKIEYLETVEKGMEIIERIENEGDLMCNIYVDDIPSLYRSKGAKIKRHIFPDEGVREKEDVVLFTNCNRDVYRLIEAGFLFGEISKREGIYTNCEKAANIIKDFGIEMKPCYSVEKEVNLEKIAEANGLDIGANGGILVEGPQKALRGGPWAIIYRGHLCVQYEISLLDEGKENEEIATLRVSSNFGKKICNEMLLKKENFDSYGKCVITLEQDINSSEGMEFLVFPKEGVKLEIEKISYRKS